MTLSVSFSSHYFPVTVPPAAPARQRYQQPHFSTLAPRCVNDLGPQLKISAIVSFYPAHSAVEAK